MYDPHKTPDMIGEMAVMNKGRLVKARLSDQDAPNVGWFWLQLGNCHACRYYQRNPPECLEPSISKAEFFDTYMFTNTCPVFEAGVNDKELASRLDVMKAVGLVNGKPSQRVVVIVDEPWSMDLAIRAHREQSLFLSMAHHADAITRGEVTNDPTRGEYVDLADDLERPVLAP